MSIQPQTHETISEETETTQIDLSSIGAEMTSTVNALPDWDAYNAACHAVSDTIERAIETEGV